MKKCLMMALMTLALFACKGNKSTTPEAEENAADEVENNVQAVSDAQQFDFVLAMQDGVEMNVLEEVKNHEVTILDFWASWCGPCCAEMPNMVSIYKNYQEKGLGIIGISLDQDYDAWTTAIEELGITWPSLLDTDGDIATKFNIEYIPYTIVVDSKGTILATNLRGDELKKFVEEQFK